MKKTILLTMLLIMGSIVVWADDASVTVSGDLIVIDLGDEVIERDGLQALGMKRGNIISFRRGFEKNESAYYMRFVLETGSSDEKHVYETHIYFSKEKDSELIYKLFKEACGDAQRVADAGL